SEPKQRTRRKRGSSDKKPSAKETIEDKRQEAFDLVLETFEALQAERSGGKGIWGSMIKQALKRRKPGFNETYYGFKTFSELLEEAAKAGLLKLQHDEKSGGYIVL
ncbi:MAG: OST-HTH/LOTUS domain-containing protein, partial [Gammaproteobacteria bacterium]